MRYCKDCWLAYHLEWKKRFQELNMDDKQKLALRIRISMSINKKRRFSQLNNQHSINQEAEEKKDIDISDFGPQIDSLIPCLDPDVAELKKTTTEQLSL